MSHKSKGSNAERELIHLLWEKQVAAARVAGSGCSRFPAPDIIAGTHNRKLAIECKSVKGASKYIPKEDLSSLVDFAKAFGCEAWIAIRFAKKAWHFMSIEDMNQTDASYVVTHETVQQKGLLLEELLQS